MSKKLTTGYEINISAFECGPVSGLSPQRSAEALSN